MKIPVILLGLAICLIFSSPRASSQVDPGKCDSCWKHWSYDSTMTLGAHLAQSITDAVNLYHFRLSQDYGINDANEIPMLLDDPTYKLRWIDSAGHPWGGFWVDSGAPLVGKPITDVGRILNGLRKRRYQKALELGFKLIVHPGVIPGIMKEA